MLIPAAILSQLLLGTGASVAGAALRGLPTIIPTKYEKENRERIEELKAKKEAGELGLTDEEKAKLERDLLTSAQGQIQRATQQATQTQAAGVGQGAGEKMMQAVTLGAATGALKGRVNEAVETADLAKAKEQETEYWKRLGADSGTKQARLGAITNIPVTAIEQLSGQAALNKTVQPTKGSLDANTKDLLNLSKSYNMDEKEVDDWLKYLGGLSEKEKANLLVD